MTTTKNVRRADFLTGERCNRHVRGVQFREMNATTGRFVARVMQYDVVDDYRTIFAPGLFAESLQQRLPKVVWAHDWSEPLGRYVDYDDTRTHLDLVGELDLEMITLTSPDGEAVIGQTPAVPRAHQAYAQLRTGTIDEFSVGFLPLDGEEVMIEERSYFKFTRARLDEASLVLAGAVPGTQLIGVRSKTFLLRGPATISKELAAQTILDLHEGKIDLADALSLIKNPNIESEEEEDNTAPPPAEDPPPPDPAPDGLPAEDPPADPPSEGDPPPADVPPAGDPSADDSPTDDIDWDEFQDVDELVSDIVV